MIKKRYAIVRVDDTCPSGHDGCKVNLVCVQDRNNIKERWCKNCLYGDTKEQLVRKIAQALELCMKKGYRTITSEEYAKFIVEFLGVEE